MEVSKSLTLIREIYWPSAVAQVVMYYGLVYAPYLLLTFQAKLTTLAWGEDHGVS